MKPTYFEAVQVLTDNKALHGKADGPLSKITLEKDVVPPTEEAIQKKLAELQAEHDAQEYARNRALAYDSVGDQLDQLMKDMRDGTTTHQTACEAVKAKYPKPS